jgi:DNA-binding NarL/FixJ family response regulator
MTTVLVLSCPPLIQNALRQQLAAANYRVIDESEAGLASADLMLLDSSQADRHDLASYRARGVKIVLLAHRTDLPGMARYLREVDSVLTYDSSVASLVKALHMVAAGERIVPAELAEPDRRSSLPMPAALTSREISVLRFVMEGSTNKVIARALGISEATVKVHLKNIFVKLQVRNRTQAAIRGKAL